MDETLTNENLSNKGLGLRPVIDPVDAPSSSKAIVPQAAEGEGRNLVFTSLVKGDSDITGLVAYSVFKQNELDWLGDFRKAKGREPTEAETEAYIIGESTPRRLATYRHLADATLAGNGPDVPGGGMSSAGSHSLALRGSAQRNPLSGASPVAYIVIALVILVGVYLAARYGMNAGH